MSDDFGYCTNCNNEGGVSGEEIQDQLAEKILEAIEQKQCGMSKDQLDEFLAEYIEAEKHTERDEYLCNGCNGWYPVRWVHIDYAEMREQRIAKQQRDIEREPSENER